MDYNNQQHGNQHENVRLMRWFSSVNFLIVSIHYYYYFHFCRSQCESHTGNQHFESIAIIYSFYSLSDVLMHLNFNEIK